LQRMAIGIRGTADYGDKQHCQGE